MIPPGFADTIASVRQLQDLQRQVLVNPGLNLLAAYRIPDMVSWAADFQAAMNAYTEPLRLQLLQIQKAIAEVTAPYETMADSFRAWIAKMVEPIAAASAVEFGVRARSLRETARKHDAALADMGWWFPRAMYHEDFLRIGQLAVERKRLSVRQEMTKLARGPLLRDLGESWMDAESFKNRRRFILDGIKDHRDGRYRVSIPTLLPLIEGIAIEEFKPKSTDANPKDALAIASAIDIDTVIVDVAIHLYGNIDFSTVQPTSRELNRHFVLHGRSTGYGTEYNSARVLFMLDQIHARVIAKQKVLTQKAS